MWQYADDDVLRNASGSVDHLFRAYLERMTRDVPCPPSVRTFIERPAYRPPGSFRCFYINPTWAGGDAPSGGVLAVKGMEPLAADFASALHDFRRPGYSPHSIAEHLVFEEHRVPGAVTLAEARGEAERAAALQAEHWHRFGTLAHVPFPLFVFRHAVGTTERVLDALSGELSEPAVHRVRQLLVDSLGVYLYYYPAPPVRVRDLETMLAGLDFRQRMFALLAICDPHVLIRRWTTTLVRMLYLAKLPATLASMRTGACCQPQNACLDGGFVDLESLTPLSAVPDDRAIYAALQISLDGFIETVHALVGGADATSSDAESGRFDRHFIEQYVLSVIEEALAAEARSPLELDPRVRAYFSRQLSFEGLVDVLSEYYPRRDRAFERDVRGFGEFGFALLRGAARS